MAAPLSTAGCVSLSREGPAQAWDFCGHCACVRTQTDNEVMKALKPGKKIVAQPGSGHQMQQLSRFIGQGRPTGHLVCVEMRPKKKKMWQSLRM